MTDRVFTVSDLDRRRREVIDAARGGLARIRDTDGTALVLVPARHYRVLEIVSRWASRIQVVERARAKPASARSTFDFGDLTWLRHLDDADLDEFVAEMRDAVSVAYHDEETEALETLVREWRTTADELADPTRRDVLLGGFERGDYAEVARPERS